jgi:hypothetical protein
MDITDERVDWNRVVLGREKDQPKVAGLEPAMSFRESRVSKVNRTVSPVHRSRGWRNDPGIADLLNALLLVGYTILWAFCYFGLIMLLTGKPYVPLLILVLLPTYFLGIHFLVTWVCKLE